jgi:hypothetical protein
VIIIGVDPHKRPHGQRGRRRDQRRRGDAADRRVPGRLSAAAAPSVAPRTGPTSGRERQLPPDGVIEFVSLELDITWPNDNHGRPRSEQVRVLPGRGGGAGFGALTNGASQGKIFGFFAPSGATKEIMDAPVWSSHGSVAPRISRSRVAVARSTSRRARWASRFSRRKSINRTPPSGSYRRTTRTAREPAR